jgi:hypothetical protein
MPTRRNLHSRPSRCPGLPFAALGLLLLLTGVGGCWRTEPDPPPFPDRKITPQELEQMDAEQRDDPYTQMNLERPPPGP